MKMTMRKVRKKSIFNEDKPWKHHNLAIPSEIEKKRYEGVWAANKGIHLPLFMTESNFEENKNGDPNQEIHGFVVRGLWRRSRLADHTLEEIWKLVDRTSNGTLDREGFLAGMWLVDQCLYGRKLPLKLDSKIWNSVSRLNVKVTVKIK
jgi:hypothetical protein